MSSTSNNPTYYTLATLRDKLRSSQKKERQSAQKELLDKLHDTSTLRNLEREAQHVFACAVERLSSTSKNGSGGSGGEQTPTFPWDRVCILYRNLMDASLLSSRTIIDSSSNSNSNSSGGGKKRNHANQTGFTKRICKYTSVDILFPYKVFLRMDADQNLECNDGGYGGAAGGAGGGGWEEDWKTRPRYGHHVDVKSASSLLRGSGGGGTSQQQHPSHPTTTGRFHARHYKPHTFTNRDRGTRLSSKEIIACVDFILFCLNDEDCIDQAEGSLLQWLLHICSRPEYIAELPFEYQLADVLHVLSIRLNRAFSDGGDGDEEERGILPSMDSSESGNRSSSRRRGPIPQECLLTVCKCLSSIIYNTTTRLGIGMQLFLRPVVRFVSTWAETAWQIQSEGQYASSSASSNAMMQQRQTQAMDGSQSAPSSHRRRLCTESDILSVMPYLYSSVTHLVAAHPEQSIAVLADHGYALLRLVRRNFARPTTNLQLREALTEYVGAHLLVAETSGKVCGLPEGDLGPLKPRKLNKDDNKGMEDENLKDTGGATLDAKAVGNLLDMIRNEKVWEALFSSVSSGHDGKNKRLRKSLASSTGQGRSGSGKSLPDGGATWTPLTRRQRRHLELMARLLRIGHRLYLADVEDRGDSTMDSVQSLIEHVVQRMQSVGIEEGVIDIDESMGISSEIVDERHIAAPSALASSPWIRMVCRHLYKLNPRLGLLDLSLRSASYTQSSGCSQYSQNGCSSELMTGKNEEGDSIERILLESCPMLQSLLVTESTPPVQQFTSIDVSDPMSTTNDAMSDSISPTTVATLQLLCACVESFPRGECWTSSARQHWSTVLDPGPYPASTLASVVERYGSSPADAAAVVYLLGTTLESHGGSGGDDDVQLWTLMTLLKMTESSAIICSRNGLSDTSAFGSASSLTALHLAWQFVWKTIFRVDMRYSSYTSGAFGNNVGEIVVQLLTQIIRYQCVDRQCLSYCQPSPAGAANTIIFEKSSSKETTSKSYPFVLGEQWQLWRLPVYEDASFLLSCAPFELITNTILCTGFSDPSDATSPASTKDRRWFVSFCLQFIELALQDNMESSIRRTYLPFAATCLASLIRDEGVRSVSTFEFDGLQLFGVTEDLDPIRYTYDVDNVHVDAENFVDHLYAALWSESVTPNQYEKDMGHGSACLIVQGRGALLNKHLNSQLERNQLRRHMDECIKPSKNNGKVQQSGLQVGVFYDTIKVYFDELLLQLKYDDGNARDDDKMDTTVMERNQSLLLPQLTVCLTLMLSAILSTQPTAKDLLQFLCPIFEDTVGAAFDLLAETLPSLSIHPSDLRVVFDHLHGIVRLLTLIAGSGVCETTTHRLLCNKAKPLFDTCKSLLKKYRNESWTLETNNQESVSASYFDSDDDDDDDDIIISSPAKIQPSQTNQSLRSNYSDYDDGFMSDKNAGNENNFRKQIAPPLKRQRIRKGSKRNITSHAGVPMVNAIDARCAWACSSLLLELNPSFQSMEFIANHIIWPGDNDNKSGYGFVSMSPDPCGALVCASLFCRKSVILRSDRLDWQSRLGLKENDDQESAIIICIESILQARRLFLPSSKYFMCGLGLVSRLVEIFSQSCGAMGIDECKMVLDAVYPEGIGKDSDDYYMLRRWSKKVLKYRSSYRAQQVHLATLIFLYAQRSLRTEFEGSFWTYFICSSFCHLDENVRTQACDVLGSTLITCPDQHRIVSDVFKCTIPSMADSKKFLRWMDKSLIDQKLRDELVNLEEEACSDSEVSIEFHSIECIALLAGHVSETTLAREMIWRLIDLAATKPVLLLPCYRACRRASFLLKYKSIGDMFHDAMPHLIVKWLESGRSLQKIPILFMSPIVIERLSRYLPNEMLAMLLSNEGWSDDYFHLDQVGGEIETLNDRVLVAFIESTAKFLIPNILFCASDELAGHDGGSGSVDATKLLTECVLILTGGDSDDNVAKVLRDHISDLYGFVAVLAENEDATLQCQNAFNLLKRCVSSVHIEKTGAETASLVLRHILLLHRKGVSVVGLGHVELNAASFIEGMKYVAKQLKSSPKQRRSSFIEHLGSSMTESIVVVKYWLSASQTIRQREESCSTLSLLWVVLVENIQAEEIESGELGFCLHSFVSVILDPNNLYLFTEIVFHSLKKVLAVLFSKHSNETFMGDVKPVLVKLCLALLQVHQRSYMSLYKACDSTLSRIESELHASLGLLAGGAEEVARRGSRLDSLKCLISSKVNHDGKVSCDAMLGAYECLEMIANSEMIQIDDILGAEEIFTRYEKEQVFRSVNEKFSLQSFFTSMQERSTKDKESDFIAEAEHFIRIMNEHPLSADDFESGTFCTSHGALARLIALQRLEKALVGKRSIIGSRDDVQGHLHHLLISICCAKEPEQSRIISSRCLGQLKNCHSTAPDQGNSISYEVIESLNDPMLSIKRTILALLGQYIISDCAGTSLVAMKTAKALLITPAGKECWQSINGKGNELLSSFTSHDDTMQRVETVRVSDSCIERLRCISDSRDGINWCWHYKLWNCADANDSSCELWMKRIVVSIISCCFGKGSKIGRGDQDFFRICQGMCAKEASFASTVFPALIFYLLDSIASDEAGWDGGCRSKLSSSITIGTPTSEMNNILSDCFSRVISPSNHRVSSQAIKVILNTLELLKSITEHRFLTYPNHTKNKIDASHKQRLTAPNKRSRSSSGSTCTVPPGSNMWKGFPYGVVLKVSGLDVADACFRVKRYYSAIYYAEMSMNNTIGIGTFFEYAANDFPVERSEAICDISGFGVLTEPGDEMIIDKALAAKRIIERCLSLIDANDELQGIVSQGLALNLKRNITSLVTADNCRRVRRGGIQTTVKQSRSDLRDQWFEDSLTSTSLWDDALLPLSNNEKSNSSHLNNAPPSLSAQPSAFYESVCGALQCFINDNSAGGSDNILLARKSVLADMEYLAGSEAESTGMLANHAKLNALGHLEQLATTLEDKSHLAYLLNCWGLHDTGADTLEKLLLNDAVLLNAKEQVITQSIRSIRTELSVKELSLKILRHKLNDGEVLISKALTAHIFKSCNIYRELGHPDGAKEVLSSLRSLLQIFQKKGLVDLSTGKLPLILRLEDAKIMQSEGNLDGAIMTCKTVANYLTNARRQSIDIELDQICADSLLLGGMWMAENNVDSVEMIFSSYFEKAARLANQICKKERSNSNIHRSSVSNFKLGEFAANLYNSVLARVSSEAWRRRRTAAKERKLELQAAAARLAELQRKSRSSNDEVTDAKIIHATLLREVNIDDSELQCIDNSLQRYLRLSFESICIALTLAPTTMTGVSKHVFQLISMWFKNCQKKDTKDIVNELLKSNLNKIPSYRLVPLVYQLFSRIDAIDDGNSAFQYILREVVLKICAEHPYHGVVQLLALSNGQRIGGGVNGRHANAYLENVGTAKVDSVNNIIKELRRRSPEYVNALIDSYQALMTSYINLAEFDTSAIQKRMTKRISFKQFKLDLDCCLSGEHHGRRNASVTNNMPAIITKPPSIRPDKQYGNGTDDPIGTERVIRFEPTFDLTPTGIHRPKIVECIGSKGGRFKQLVKGEDDLRQDAIMQQVFGTVNDLLRHENYSIGATRQLRLITYGITPLSPASGVLEWVDNTMCFGDFLMDKGKSVGAHSRYFPGEWGYEDARDVFRSASDAENATLESKRLAFDRICENFSPAFRFFFLEYFKSSMEAWHTARTLYTRSCAVNSIVGHILGIGDRHTSNILVHTRTGEVVHIDFGIVFEQGKTLTTPELVPFRLTRDVVDGMGPSGTDGVFSRAAEATMDVMRNNADSLLIILSAVVSDPLYKWSLSQLPTNQHQKNDDERAGNDAAERAIAKIHEKLEGYEYGTSGVHKTVAGQVKLLINEARDPDNLCAMFVGWAPWM